MQGVQRRDSVFLVDLCKSHKLPLPLHRRRAAQTQHPSIAAYHSGRSISLFDKLVMSRCASRTWRAFAHRLPGRRLGGLLNGTSSWTSIALDRIMDSCDRDSCWYCCLAIFCPTKQGFLGIGNRRLGHHCLAWGPCDWILAG